MCKSDCSPIWFRPRHQEIVLGRLTGFSLLNSVIRLLRGAIAGYSLWDGGTVAFEKAPQNFYMGDGDGYSLCKSDCFPMWFRPVHEKIVRERLDGAIRLLRGETAGYSFLYNGSKPYHIEDGTTFTVFPSPSSAILPTHSRSAQIQRKIIAQPICSRRYERSTPQ